MSDNKIDTAMREEKLQPYSNYMHLICLLVYTMGRVFSFRGDSEIIKREWADIDQGKYSCIHTIAGFECTHITVGNGAAMKARELSAENPGVTQVDIWVRLLDIQGLSWDPTQLIKYYRKYCPKDQIRLVWHCFAWFGLV